MSFKKRTRSLSIKTSPVKCFPSVVFWNVELMLCLHPVSRTCADFAQLGQPNWALSPYAHCIGNAFSVWDCFNP